MIKRLLYITIALISSMCLSAQTSSDNWKIHAIFGDDIQNIIDTGNKIYYLASGNLYSYDKDWEESEHYSKQTKLSSVNIKDIYYSYELGVLAITYEDSNIDFLYDDGRLINAPDIYNSDIIDKGINCINFEGKKVYVATDFGFAILNGNKGFEVSESRNYNTRLLSVDEIGGRLWISTQNDILYSPSSQKHLSMSEFTPMNNGGGGKIYKISDTKFIFSNWGIQLITSAEGGNPELQWITDLTPIASLQPTKTGFIALDKNAPRNLISFDSEGKYSKTELPEDMSASLLSSQESDGSLWELSAKGIRHIKLNGSSATILSDFFRLNASSVSYPYYLRYNNSQKRLYVWNCGPNLFQGDYNKPAHVNYLDANNVWFDKTPENVPTIGTYAENILKDPFYPVFDPEDPDTYFVGTFLEGVYKITDGKVVAKYDWTNSPLKQDWSCEASGLCFDKDRNLWLIQGINNPAIYVLPRAKQSKSDLTASDWITVKVNISDATNHFMQALITNKNLKVFAVNSMGSDLMVIDDNGNPASSSIKYRLYSSGELYDQDEKAYTWTQIACMAEDANGKIWMGTNNGVIEFNPNNALNDNFRINRIKVPRNDGTNLADYLLSGTSITAIAVDGANRKWIGTVNMGIYLVSSDGSKILKHFSTDNSALTSDRIVSICCNPNSNSVYIGTPTGLIEYYSDAAPAAEDYSGIYAYPNPVTPDFTGEITITGLMENSLVKIADAAGNVIRSLQSTGGMVTWNGCYSNGERVKTGVYYVLASQNENSKSSGIVTKILFIK